MYFGAAPAFDRFGYALPNLSKDENAVRNGMLSSDAAKARSWTSPDILAFSQKRLKQLVREGIPAALRLQVWLQLSKGGALCAEHSPGYFASLAAKPVSKAFAMDLESAVLRHLPGHQYLSLAVGVQSASSVAWAYRQHTQRPVQQSTFCIAAFLVSLFGVGQEEECFWIMIGLLSAVWPGSCPQEAAVRLEQDVLQELARKRCPKLCSALVALDSSLLDLTRPWVSNLFCTSLPAETVVRVWDCLLSEGPKVLFRVALALLKREEIVIAGNLQKFRNVQWRISRTYNADALLKVAFKGIGSLSMAEVTKARRSVEGPLLHGQSQQVKRLEALLCPPRLSPQPSSSSGTSELSTIMEGPETPRSTRAAWEAADLSAFQQCLPPLKT